MELSLNLPAQYADIEQEEMMYLDGGFGIPNWIVSSAINIGIAAFTGGGGVKLFLSWMARKGSAEAAKQFKNILVRFVATQVANRVSGLVVGAINGFLTFSVGGALTTIWDRNDVNRNNGWLNALW